MNRRRGFSLIEVATVVATAAALMGVAVGLLYMLLRLEQGSRDYVRQRTAMCRLADQFRRDVHAADDLTPIKAPAGEDAGPAWEFSLPADHVVEYRVEQGELVRTERAEGKPVRRESFRLPAEATVSIELLGDWVPGIVRLERKEAKPVPRESFRLPAEATVSIDLLGDWVPGMVRLEVSPGAAQSNVAPWRGFRVDAMLAKDRRFVEQTEP